MKKAILFVSLFFAMWTIECGKRESAPVRQSEPTAVKVARPMLQEITEQFAVNGTAESLRTIEVFADVTGKVIEKFVQLGDRVQKGETLMRVMQDIPGMDFSPVGVDAPISGMILNEAAEVGSRLTPQRACFSIGVIDTILIKARLLESDFSRVRVGTGCKVTADALPNVGFSGRLRRISPVVDSRSRTAVAEIVVANPSGRLLPGMSVVCEFTVGSRRAFTVPLDAVTRVDADYRLIKIADGRARFVTVPGGMIVNGRMEITEHLAADDLVVIYGQNLVQDGGLVQIIEE